MSRGFSPVAVVVVIAFVLTIAGGTFVAWRTTVLDPYLPAPVRDFFGHTPSTTGTSSEGSKTTSKDSTKDWKTYTNTEFGFSFKYPGEWLIYPGVNGGVLGNLGKFIVDLASAPKSGGEVVYPTAPVLLRVIFVTDGYYDGLGKFNRFKSAEDYVCRSGLSECFSSLKFKVYGGKKWVEETISPEYAPLLFTQGSRSDIYSIYIPKDLAKEHSGLIELVVSTLEL